MQINEKEKKILIEAFRGNPAQLTEHKEETKYGCMNEPKTYFIDQFLDHLAEVRTGDTVILPKFTVPAVTMAGYDRAGDLGHSGYYHASYAGFYVRPRFVIEARKSVGEMAARGKHRQRAPQTGIKP